MSIMTRTPEQSKFIRLGSLITSVVGITLNLAFQNSDTRADINSRDIFFISSKSLPEFFHAGSFLLDALMIMLTARLFFEMITGHAIYMAFTTFKEAIPTVLLAACNVGFFSSVFAGWFTGLEAFVSGGLFMLVWMLLMSISYILLQLTINVFRYAAARKARSRHPEM